MPARSIELEQFEFLGTPPLCQDNSPRSVMFGDPCQASNIVRRGSRRRTSFGLNHDHFEKVSALESRTVMAVILSDGDHIDNTASFSSRLPPEIYQVPLGSRAPTIGNEPLRHSPCPLGRVVGLLARAHLFRRPCHDLGSERRPSGARVPRRLDGIVGLSPM